MDQKLGNSLINYQVEASSLKPFTTYFYQFQVCHSDNKSPVGRTKTTPHSDEEVDQINLAVYSCSNYRMSASGVCLCVN